MSDQYTRGYLVGTDIRTTFIKPRHEKQWTPVQYAVVEVDDFEHVKDTGQQPGKKKLAVCEGCIILGTHAEMEAVADHLRSHSNQLKASEAQGSAIKGDRYRWPKGKIPYEIHPALTDPQRVLDAIAHWHEKTKIRLVPRSGEDDFVVFVPGPGCASAVGRQGGRQEIVLGSSCTTGNAIHEIGHTVGLWHEQSRIDRDTWVEIVWQNIDPLYRHNFEQHIDDGIDVAVYDYGSVMHYPATAFSRNGKPTISKRQIGGPEIGQRTGLSDGDIKSVEEIYPDI